MKIILLIVGLLFCKNSICQQDNLLLLPFPITDYITTLNDSVKLVQVKMPGAIVIKEKEEGLLRQNRQIDDVNTNDIGLGKCQLVKGEYCYFAITINADARQPKEGDLLYILVDVPGMYNGFLYNVVTHGITLNKIDDTPLLTVGQVVALTKKSDEDELINTFIEEVKFAAKTMVEQSDNQDMVIPSGIHKGKKIFATMQAIKTNEIIDFLKYIDAKAGMYGETNWKFAEIFATWLADGSPKVTKTK